MGLHINPLWKTLFCRLVRLLTAWRLPCMSGLPRSWPLLRHGVGPDFPAQPFLVAGESLSPWNMAVLHPGWDMQTARIRIDNSPGSLTRHVY
ncbi:hypothetical protein MTBLM1_30316 [Rhodospirillaceae bacterium LM-1]|nr:hypothetical protein MTBLM1_30316 [Rhodospirillaceae bacterium LM-1]